MDKYKKLISNTIIFAISTFSSKVLVFLLMPLYTRVLDTSAYGVTDLLMNTGNLLLPLVTPLSALASTEKLTRRMFFPRGCAQFCWAS